MSIALFVSNVERRGFFSAGLAEKIIRRHCVPMLACLAILFTFAVLIFATGGAFGAEPTALSIVRITPTGRDVPPGRQIVIQFNRAVVPVGRMERRASEIPITISPKLNCQWRWLNTSALACQLDEKSALTPATRYDIVVHPGIMSEDGATLAKPVAHSFITERPKVLHAWFKTWQAPGMPLIRMTFNQPVSLVSVAEHVFITVAAEKQQRVSLKVEPDPDDRQPPFMLPLPGEKLVLVPGDGQASDQAAHNQEQPGSNPQAEARRVWLVSPADELPLDTRAQLEVEPGLVSTLGPEPGTEKRVLVAFDTFPEFAFEGVE